MDRPYDHSPQKKNCLSVKRAGWGVAEEQIGRVSVGRAVMTREAGDSTGVLKDNPSIAQQTPLSGSLTQGDHWDCPT